MSTLRRMKAGRTKEGTNLNWKPMQLMAHTYSRSPSVQAETIGIPTHPHTVVRAVGRSVGWQVGSGSGERASGVDWILTAGIGSTTGCGAGTELGGGRRGPAASQTLYHREGGCEKLVWFSVRLSPSAL